MFRRFGIDFSFCMEVVHMLCFCPYTYINKTRKGHENASKKQPPYSWTIPRCGRNIHIVLFVIILPDGRLVWLDGFMVNLTSCWGPELLEKKLTGLYFFCVFLSTKGWNVVWQHKIFNTTLLETACYWREIIWGFVPVAWNFTLSVTVGHHFCNIFQTLLEANLHWTESVLLV